MPSVETEEGDMSRFGDAGHQTDCRALLIKGLGPMESFSRLEEFQVLRNAAVSRAKEKA